MQTNLDALSPTYNRGPVRAHPYRSEMRLRSSEAEATVAVEVEVEEQQPSAAAEALTIATVGSSFRTIRRISRRALTMHYILGNS